MNGERDNRFSEEGLRGRAERADSRPFDPAVAAVKEIKGTVAALRLDAVLALGFGISRSRAVILVKGGLVQVNGKPVEAPARRVQQGDLIAIRGRGHIEIAALTGESRKGRQGLNLKKYIP